MVANLNTSQSRRRQEQIPFLGGILENSSRKTQELLSDTAVAGGVLCPERAAVTMAKAT
jgi:hypothetical protein